MSDEAPPVCYRHAGKETYVHCVRCDKPICPDCMREAPVGFQCVECIREGAKTLRAVSAPYETKKVKTVGQTSAVSTALRGRVTPILLGINILAFILEGFPVGFGRGGPNTQFASDYFMSGAAVAYNHEYYRLVTAAFLHAGLLHIAFNMLALWQLGSILERLLGTWRYIALYFAGAVAGNTLSFLLRGEQVVSLGASTAIFGFFSAFYLIVKKQGGDTGQLVQLIVINLLITFSFSNYIDWRGHVGGLIGGAIIGYIYTQVAREKPQLQAGLVIGFVVACFALCVFKSTTVPDLSSFLPTG